MRNLIKNVLERGSQPAPAKRWLCCLVCPQEAERLQKVLDKEAARAQKQQDKDVHRWVQGYRVGVRVLGTGWVMVGSWLGAVKEGFRS